MLGMQGVELWIGYEIAVLNDAEFILTAKNDQKAMESALDFSKGQEKKK